MQEQATTLVFVASDRTKDGSRRVYQDGLRYALHGVWELCHWTGPVVVIDAGLTAAQRDALAHRGVAVVPAGHGFAAGDALRQRYMWKAWADLRVIGDGPLLVLDADLEFRDSGVLDELSALVQTKFVIAEERQRWALPGRLPVPSDAADAEAWLYLAQEYGPLAGQTILNAGLFGGPRPLLDGILSLVRLAIPGTLRHFGWFWEQLALSAVLRREPVRRFVEILPPEYNWLPAFGQFPPDQAKIVHYTYDQLAEGRAAIPDDFLKPRLRRAAPDQVCGAGASVKAMVT